MTISQTLADQMAEDIQAEQIRVQVGKTVPRALLDVLGLIIQNATDEDGVISSTVTGDEFNHVVGTISQVLNLMGFEVDVQDDDEGIRTISLVSFVFESEE